MEKGTTKEPVVEDAAVNLPESAARKVEGLISPADALGMMPPGLRFHFLDEIQEIDDTHVVARYRFREDEYFYQGHFPERGITPGTILLEAMCQCGVTVHSYYLLARETSIAQARQYRILFTGATVEWFEQIGPNNLITLRSELLAWRRRRIRSRVRVFDKEGRLSAESEISGYGVLLSKPAEEEGSAGAPAAEINFVGNNHDHHGRNRT